MWIEKLDNGKFKAVERYEDYLSGKTKRVSITFEKNTAQERKRVQAALTKKINKKIKESSSTHEVTLKELIEAYRKDQLNTVKESTYKRNYHASKSLMTILGENTIVNRLDAGIIRKKFIDTGKSPGTLNEHMTRLKAILRWGYRNDMVNNISYLDKLERFKDIPHRKKIEDKYMESEEVNELLSTMTVEKWHDLTKFQILTGMRIGEALALTVSDLDTDKRIINVSKNYDMVNEIVSESPKNAPSIREVFIQDELLPLCSKIKRNAIKYKIYSGSEVLFQDKDGRYDYWAYNKYLKSKTESIIGRRLTTHALRHTHVSLLAEQGIDFDTIARRVGHEDSEITKEIYFHVTKKLKEKDNQKINSTSLL